MKAKVLEEVVREESVHEIFKIESLGNNNQRHEYKVEVKTQPSCPDFADRDQKKKPYLACKHLYFVYLRVLGLSQNENMFVHQPLLSQQDLYNALNRTRSYPCMD